MRNLTIGVILSGTAVTYVTLSFGILAVRTGWRASASRKIMISLTLLCLAAFLAWGPSLLPRSCNLTQEHVNIGLAASATLCFLAIRLCPGGLVALCLPLFRSSRDEIQQRSQETSRHRRVSSALMTFLVIVHAALLIMLLVLFWMPH